MIYDGEVFGHPSNDASERILADEFGCDLARFTVQCEIHIGELCSNTR